MSLLLLTLLGTFLDGAKEDFKLLGACLLTLTGVFFMSTEIERKKRKKKPE
jgi:hypothetical protein